MFEFFVRIISWKRTPFFSAWEVHFSGGGGGGGASWGGGSKKSWSGRGASHAKPARKVKISRMYSIDSERHCFFLTTEQTIFSDFGDFGV